MEDAVRRECVAARQGVAVMDASTLGKIDIQGPDAAVFLDRIYTNIFSTLPEGQCRYGLMCKADGIVFDDGVTTRLGKNHFLMTTTTGGAAGVLAWLEEWLQTEWPDLKVYCTSVTEHISTIALVGPKSRQLLRELVTDIDLSKEAFPFMHSRDGNDRRYTGTHRAHLFFRRAGIRDQCCVGSCPLYLGTTVDARTSL